MTGSISALDAKRWLASGDAVLIDVREADEFKAEHIPYASSLPLRSVSELLAGMPLPKGKKLLFQCQRGMRGDQACAAVRAGTVPQEVYNIEGGIEAWKAAGLPVVAGQSATSLSLFRQVQIIVGALVALGAVAGFNGFPVGFSAAGIFGVALFLAGVTGWCLLAKLLAVAPWNRP